MQKSCAGPFNQVITYIIYPHMQRKPGVISRLFTSFFIYVFDSSRLYRRRCCGCKYTVAVATALTSTQ